VLPILLWLSIGVIELAKLLRASQILSNAAREGARLSILPENAGNTAPALARIQAYLTTENQISCTSAPTATINQSDYIVQPNGVAITASQVTVQCTYALQYLPALSAGAIANNITLTGKATFRNFY
jgi:Flp pilus assembly protein TadG